MNDMPPISSSDLAYVFNATKFLWEDLRNQNIFITGGTGFVGTWLLTSFVWANEKLNLNAKALILTRDIARFKKKCPHLYSNPSLLFEEGDITNFKFPIGHFSHIIHAAAETLPKLEGRFASDSIFEGTKRTLEFAKVCGAKRFLFVSSGAIYGKNTFVPFPIIEDSFSECLEEKDEQNLSSYALGKREAEKLCHSLSTISTLEIKIARCFAFVGPYLPLDSHFAIGNFILNGLNNEPIQIKGDGTPHRSYLYAADLAIWLWTILLRGLSLRPYNVGSEETITIKELADLVSACFDSKIEIYTEYLPIAGASNYYVPNTTRAREELRLIQQTSLKKAIQSTIKWYSFLRQGYEKYRNES